MKLITLSLPEYVFNTTCNPYFFDEINPKSLGPIAEKIERAIRNNFDINNIMIRGIQSGHHTSISRKKLIDTIVENGNDVYDTRAGSDNIIHAALFGGGVIIRILEAFHKYKPKGEERPQLQVDIWMIIDKSAYDNIEYVHPRHGVIANDKWRQHSDGYGLIGLIVISADG